MYVSRRTNDAVDGRRVEERVEEERTVQHLVTTLDTLGSTLDSLVLASTDDDGERLALILCETFAHGFFDLADFLTFGDIVVAMREEEKGKRRGRSEGEEEEEGRGRCGTISQKTLKAKREE